MSNAVENERDVDDYDDIGNGRQLFEAANTPFATDFELRLIERQSILGRAAPLSTKPL
jgi:hypothetical protein